MRQSFDDANPYPKDCPAADLGDDGLDAMDSIDLYDLPPPAASSVVEEEVCGVRVFSDPGSFLKLSDSSRQSLRPWLSQGLLADAKEAG